MMRITPLSKESLDSLVDYGKALKSTFLSVNPNGHVYGFLGIANYDNLCYRLGVLKYGETSNGLPFQFQQLPEIPFGIQTKDIVALQKLPGNTGADISYYFMSNDNMYPAPVSISRNEITINLFSNVQMEMAYYGLIDAIKLSTLIVDEDITENEQFQSICALKASQGGKMFHIDGCSIFLTGNMLNINKGDRVHLLVYQEPNGASDIVHIQVNKPKKHMIVHSIFRVISLRG